MLTWWRGRSKTGRTATNLYGSIVAAARREPFYVAYGVSDTPDGRFALLVAHMFLVMERLRGEDVDGQELSRALVETFVTDMDDSMREMGVGDLSVPKKVKKAAGALYDSVAAIRQVADEPEEILAGALRQTLMQGETEPAALAVAAYIRCAGTALGDLPLDELLAGRVKFADVQSRKEGSHDD